MELYVQWRCSRMVFKVFIKTLTCTMLKIVCHFTQYYNEYSTQSESQWLHGEHTRS